MDPCHLAVQAEQLLLPIEDQLLQQLEAAGRHLLLDLEAARQYFLFGKASWMTSASPPRGTSANRIENLNLRSRG